MNAGESRGRVVFGGIRRCCFVGNLEDRCAESGRRVTWWMRRRCTVPSHCPSLLAICANCRFFRMPCWCLAQLHPHPGSLHDSDRGCFQCPQFGQRTCDGGLTRGFPPDPATIAPSPSPLDPRATSRSIDARARVGRDGALAFDKFSRPARSPTCPRLASTRVQLCALRPAPVTPRARRIDRTDARAKGRETNLSMGVVAMSQGARPSPVPRRPFPRSRHRRRRPETKGGIPLSAGRDPSLSDEPMTSHPRRTDVPPTPTTQSQRRRGCAP